MATSLNDHLDSYNQACTAYAQQKYDIAATLVDKVLQNMPDDPNCHLLRGHIYYVLQQYDVAQEEYQKVLQLSDDKEIIGFANGGLANINLAQEGLEPEIDTGQNHQPEPSIFTASSDDLEPESPELEDLGVNSHLNNNSLELNSLEPLPPFVDVEQLSANPFEIPSETISFNPTPDSTAPFNEDPFAVNQNQSEAESHANIKDEQVELDLPLFWQEETGAERVKEPENSSNLSDTVTDESKDGTDLIYDENVDDAAFAEIDFSTSHISASTPELVTEESEADVNIADYDLQATYTQEEETEVLLMKQENLKHGSTAPNDLSHNFQDDFPESESSNWLEKIEVEEQFSSLNGSSSPRVQQISHDATVDINDFNNDFDFEAFQSAFGSEEETSNLLNGENSQSNIDFLDDFGEFDDLTNIPEFDVAETDSSFDDVTMLSGTLNSSGSKPSQDASHYAQNQPSDSIHPETNRDDELFSITGSDSGVQEAAPTFIETDDSEAVPNVSIEQGWLAPLENASLDVKPWFVAGTVGIFSALVVATVSFTTINFAPPEQRTSVRNTGWAMSLAAGIAGFGTAAFMGSLTLKQIRRTTKDLQAQFDAVRQGNLNVQATVYSEDELGRLATGFNEMARVIFTTTSDAQRKAVEQEEAKENLQRQVIRLLDDVEGAARGDLTVQAEVTADVLGAVADAFNLTIQNLRDIVQQVTVAAKEVTKGATNSETFARALSSDALRQAEELGVTLNSVQVMTDCIKRIAEAAREAEIVAGDASAIALKGGEAVENTVAGILEIRETVAETTRKVKRLAESSQEISKIVALISQIASRTNLLALNASIEAARAGEAGRGFAIVADEVRQLADKSAKSLKEIEQIVMQIQSETGSVMTAMEEGTQQVIKGTKLAEEAKRSLENIIQVANRIDTLVRSITSDTVEQTETSRAVAHVMQSVELTAQETSQEAQRVSGALQLLVGVSGDLISSVERFRVETLESK
ncbi:methyl-accepting chemotaxis protein [Nodularia sp. UHCC 0506]|uniref:methyl-accepting chemotaxis protein n=1 Tax=Nodularia sp. UHCC 0506 TaxID=3110243 RepID=UPI002B21406A|nr:methyl-accepting chemotaxis protein [Nodularia sp. UHCC 0506]MEA5515858.1 methyl-accepting chemotaxis protein [Nodularia sp. UHCC 0506]